MINKLKNLYEKANTQLVKTLVFWLALHGFHRYIFKESMPMWATLYIGITMTYWFVTGLNTNSNMYEKMIEDIRRSRGAR